MPKLRNGHAPGHVRDTAVDAFEAWLDWDGRGPEPTVEYEIDYVPHRISRLALSVTSLRRTIMSLLE
jgi:hypothetical protein